MASAKGGNVAESSSGGFSYAQAAKGRSASTPSAKVSSTGVSGTATPSTASASDMTPGSSWADDTESKSSSNTSSESTKSNQPTSTPSTGTSSAEAPTASPEVSTARSADALDKGDVILRANKEAKSSEDVVDSSVTATESGTELKETTSALEEVDSTPSEAPPVKPAYQEAKPPAVNIWLQRAADAKAKAGPQSASTASSPQVTKTSTLAENDRIRSDPRRRSEVPISKRTDVGPRARDDNRVNAARRGPSTDFTPSGSQRRTPPKPRERANSAFAPPPTGSDFSWPKPTDVRDENKKKLQDRDQTSATTLLNGKPHGKTEWKVMPYTPTAVFETNVAGRGSGRMGRGGASMGRSGRGGMPVADHSRPNGRAPSLPNGEATSAERTDPLRTDREAMPPPSSTKTGRASSEGNLRETTSNDAPQKATDLTPTELTTPLSISNAAEAKTFVPADPTLRQSIPLRRNQSQRKQDNPKRAGPEDMTRRSSVTTATEGEQTQPSSQPDSVLQNPVSADHRAEFQSLDAGREPPAYRENKRGGRKGGRGGFGSAHYPPGSHYSNGFADMPGGYGIPPQSPYHQQRTNGFVTGRNAYRNSPRANSTPFDAYGRASGAYAGYPMMGPVPPYMSYYDAPYSPGPYMTPASPEADLVLTGVLQQINYYFSLDNILKDMHLRKHMDGQGWVFLTVIAQFNRLKSMTQDYDLIKAACLRSIEVEIRVGNDNQDRVRRREGWEQFLVPEGDRHAAAQNAGPDPATLRRPSVSRNRSFEQPAFFPQSPSATGHPGRFSGSEQPFQMTDGGPPAFIPGGFDPRYADYMPAEETRGRQSKMPHHHHQDDVSPLANGQPAPDGEAASEPDTFPSSQIDGLTVVVRKHEVARSRAPYHNSSSRTFSNGSLDARNIMEEVEKTSEASPQINGTASTNGYV